MPGKGINITVKAHSKAPQQKAFDIVLPIDLPQVFTGYGPIPAVKSVEHFDDGWNAAGQSRQINLADGSHGIEHMLTFENGKSFGYEIRPFTGLVGSFVDHAEGEWSFTPDGDGTTVQWSYTWVPKRFGAPALWPLTKLWRPYAQRVVERCAKVAETAEAA
jgi:hypothetical protein